MDLVCFLLQLVQINNTFIVISRCKLMCMGVDLQILQSLYHDPYTYVQASTCPQRTKRDISLVNTLKLSMTTENVASEIDRSYWTAYPIKFEEEQ